MFRRGDFAVAVVASLLVAASVHCQPAPRARRAPSIVAAPIAADTTPDATTAQMAVPPADMIPQGPGGAVAALPSPAPLCAAPCFVIKDYWPFRECKQECSADVCARGWGVYTSQEVCCSPGVAFSEGCSQRPSECWVVESQSLKTCMRDDRKCLQGYGVYPSREACCAPGTGAFGADGCSAVMAQPSAKPCWVVDTYFPARLCRQSTTLCAQGSGQQSWPTQAECCAPNKAFPEGCSAAPPPTPCWLVDTYWPSRLCKQSGDVAVCNRGWGVYASKDVCCAPNVGFPEGCTPDGSSATGPTTGSAEPAAASGTLPTPVVTRQSATTPPVITTLAAPSAVPVAVERNRSVESLPAPLGAGAAATEPLPTTAPGILPSPTANALIVGPSAGRVLGAVGQPGVTGPGVNKNDGA